MRIGGPLLAWALTFAIARPASAEGTAECVVAAERGQTLRDERKLVEARQTFVRCSRDTCAAQVKADCIGWLASVEARLPEVVFAARDDAGADLAAVRVFVDDELVTSHLDGSAVPLDPGEHVVRFESGGSRSVVHLVVREFEKGRIVEGRLSRVPAAPPPEHASPRSSALILGLAGIGAAAFASYAYFGLTLRDDVDRMRGTCAPGCPTAEVDAARRGLVMTNVSFAVGVVALSAAVVTYFFRPKSSPAKAPPPL